jgi:hypothetical protein
MNCNHKKRNQFLMFKHHMKTYGEMKVYFHHFLPRHQMKVSGLLQAPAALFSWERAPWYPSVEELGLDNADKRKISCP